MLPTLGGFFTMLFGSLLSGRLVRRIGSDRLLAPVSCPVFIRRREAGQ